MTHGKPVQVGHVRIVRRNVLFFVGEIMAGEAVLVCSSCEWPGSMKEWELLSADGGTMLWTIDSINEWTREL